MSRFEVVLTDEAKLDLVELHEFVQMEDSLSAADHLLNRLETCCEALHSQPNRGHVPSELARLGGQLEALSPLRTMGRGYVVATAADGSLVTSVQRLTPGDRLDLHLRDGDAAVRVESVAPNPDATGGGT